MSAVPHEPDSQADVLLEGFLEVTSSKPAADREAKRGNDYRRHCTVPFGKPIRLPSPFDLDLKTEDFL